MFTPFVFLFYRRGILQIPPFKAAGIVNPNHAMQVGAG